jgi:hypothetical protein
MAGFEIVAPGSGEVSIDVRLIPGTAPERGEAWWTEKLLKT